MSAARPGSPRTGNLPVKPPTPLRPLHTNEAISNGASPANFSSVRHLPGAPKPAPLLAEPTAPRERQSVGATRYATLCRRLFVDPDPAYLAALNGEHAGEYSTRAARVALDADGAFALVSVLEYCRGLHSLRLAGLRRAGAPMLKKETLAAVVAAVRNSPTIRLLDLSDDALTDEIGAAPLGRLMAQNSTLGSLCLAHNELGPETARALLTHLPANKALHELDLSDNPPMRWAGQAKEMEKLFKENVHITSFGGSLPEAVGGAVLGVCARAAGRMRRLRLPHAPLAAGHVSLLASILLSKTAALTELDLTEARAQDAGAARLASALHGNRSLTRLALGHNGVGARGGVSLAEALRVNPTLTHLGLHGNLLTDAATVALASALASNGALTRLELGRNAIYAIGAQALRQALHANQSLTSLGDLTSLPIGVGLRASLEWYLRNNAARLEAHALEAQRAASARDSLLQLLPAEERALRRHVFHLEDATAKLEAERAQQQVEAAQVDTLLAQTIKRNAELADTVASLQGQVDTLRRHALGKKVKAKKGAARKAAKKALPKSQAVARAPAAASAAPAPSAAAGTAAPPAGGAHSSAAAPSAVSPSGGGSDLSGFAGGYLSAFEEDLRGEYPRWDESGEFEGFAIGDGIGALQLSPKSTSVRSSPGAGPAAAFRAGPYVASGSAHGGGSASASDGASSPISVGERARATLVELGELP